MTGLVLVAQDCFPVGILLNPGYEGVFVPPSPKKRGEVILYIG